MPDPSKYDSESEWMSACIPAKKAEGKTQEQAVGACLGIWREKKEMEENAMSLWKTIKEFFSKEKPMKTVDGEKYPASDFLVAEDAQSPDTWHLQVKRHGTPDHNLMGAAKAALTSPGGHRGNKYQGPNKTEAIAKLKRLYEAENMEWTKENIHPFMVWKEETGYRWLAVYSNKWRDDDNPPEILAEAAHKEFVEAVDKGDWPYPEVWLWHVEGTKFGVADFVAYDESGFALASGPVDKDKESVAEALSQKDNLATSHGMPIKEIQRDEKDQSIIVRYRTIEVTALPFEAAANKHGTGFQILAAKEVDDMLPDRKRPFLKDIMGEEGVEALEKMLADKAEELKEQGIEFKEEVQEEVQGEPQAEPVEEAKEEAPEYPTRQEVAEAVGAYLKPLFEQVQTLVEAVGAFDKELKEQREVLDELQKDDVAKIKAFVADTPAASLFAQIGSVIGAPETYVDGRSTLAKSGPQQEKEFSDGPASVGIINEYMALSRGG